MLQDLQILCKYPTGFLFSLFLFGGAKVARLKINAAGKIPSPLMLVFFYTCFACPSGILLVFDSSSEGRLAVRLLISVSLFRYFFVTFSLQLFTKLIVCHI